MRLTDSDAHRALFYLAAVARHQYAMTSEEFDAFARSPDRVLPIAEERRKLTAFEALNTNWTSSIQKLFAGPANAPEVVVKPGRVGESMREYLARLGWINEKNGRVRLTPLGDAVLGHLEDEQTERLAPTVIKLDGGDDFAIARVIGRIAEMEDAALVEPYLDLDSLTRIIESTHVNRILVGARDPNRLAQIKVGLEVIEVDREIEVRSSNEFHDRYVISASGEVLMLGTSLNGVGKRTSTLVEATDPRFVTSLNDQFEEVWEAAGQVGRAVPSEPHVDTTDDLVSKEIENGEVEQDSDFPAELKNDS